MTTFAPGTLVTCRGREWVVLPSEAPDLLLLRPLGGSERETTGIYIPLMNVLEIERVETATFPPPDPAMAGDHTAGQLLRDAARLSFRSGAGPFRSLGRINARPRPFQIVPLLMALRLDPVRLLIADDVGIGKTIEAALIARELLDRGDARRLAVICPPHLCEQWQRELADKFAIDAVIVRSGTISQLERALPPGDISVFEYYPVLIVSVDFVKSDRRRDSFIRSCPDLVIVDEAHTATRASGTRGTQQRYDLLHDLAAKAERHLLLLTATPHSGVEDAFRSLLELLDPSFSRLDTQRLSDTERRTLARHFVQRRRADVQRWMGEETPFPTRESHEITYSLSRSPEYQKLFQDIYSFARTLVRDDTGLSVWKRRVRYWAALALLRCVMSSPQAAATALQARANRLAQGEPVEDNATVSSLATYVLDLGDQEVPQDFEPAPVIEEGEQALGAGERSQLNGFVKRALALRGEADPKAELATKEVAQLLRDGFRPIVFCRYIATAEYLAAELRRRLKKEFPALHAIAVTGASSEEEREQRVAEIGGSPVRVMVATDCLSEGINLQSTFDSVIHYDLPWNPNRLEQREGRVDRYGQPAPIVRSTLLYGVDNPIDEAVLKVLLRKAVSIHKSLGITVPLPVDSESVVESVVRSLFQDDPQASQASLFDDEPLVDVDELHRNWDRAVEEERVSRTRFAQHAIKPEEVAQELYETDLVLGNPATVAAFVRNACQQLQAPLVAVSGRKNGPPIWRLRLAELPLPLRERTARAWQSRPGADMPAEVQIGFETPLPDGVHLIGRIHPLTEAIAEYLLDSAMVAAGADRVASRSGAIRTADVERRTVVLLLRMRLLINSPGRSAPLLAEELVVAGFAGSPAQPAWLDEATARRLLDEAQPSGNLDPTVRQEMIARALEQLNDLKSELTAITQARAAALLAAHKRVRQATSTGKVSVQPAPQAPFDVLGLYVFLPVPKGIAP
jgi:superfamily II DNA or RNA helicase